ncbi:hypothetical protein GP486_007403 [Trichoglossum hirsutum]|uniref:1,3-beta-glucanosyltransferase n=1 Tax=Trichoglossum hirsutum TaxID=265104 RepID=A0A9P8L4W5_9PEZI|nr:hypothetical protein GP486_007403 [Trichoglossum hirsutum]
MHELGANAIRVYHVDSSGDHKGCMDAFAAKGIYVFADLATFNTEINQDDVHWNQTQFTAFTKILDEFAKFDNTAGVFIGNEAITKANGSEAAPYIKAAVRDVKNYRDSKNMRKIPIGYSAADIAELRPMLQNYLVCGKNASESIDFFALNAYEWCGQSSYTVSGYNQLTKNATGYPVPIFFSETGCNTNRPRDFADQSAIFGDQMVDYWSGAIIYEWIEEANNYGLIQYGSKTDSSESILDGYPRSGTPTPISPDFNNLKSQWSTLSPTGVKESAYSPTNTPPPCPPSTTNGWRVNGDVPLPTLGQTFTAGATPTGTATGSAASATATKKGSASVGKEITGMTIGLVGVMFGFTWWL